MISIIPRMSKTTIQIEKTTRRELGDICHKNQSYDSLIRELIALKKDAKAI